MPPKPFPLPLGVGVDIIKLSRLKLLLRNHYALNRWAQKTFNRLEWPALVEVFQPQPFQKVEAVKEQLKNRVQSQLVLPEVHADNLRLTEKVLEYLAGRLVPEDFTSYTLRDRACSLIFLHVLLGGP